MAEISLCMIVRNEEDVLERCLQSVHATVDEIIIADTGSADRTKEIAAAFTSKIYDFPWCDDFAAARNFAFSKAEKDYQMWLDADDVLEDPDALLRLKEGLTADVVMLPYHVAFDKQGSPLTSYYRERLLKRSRGFRWEGAVHECITPSGAILYGNAAVLHKKLHTGDPDRNLRIYEKLLASGRSLTPREQYYYARELYYHRRFADAAEAFRCFLDRDGWLEDRIGACLLLSECLENTGDLIGAKSALLRTLLWDEPRAEVCCALGRLFFEEKRYPEAVFWYKAALSAPFPVGGFSQGDCHDYIPLLQLCVCYDRMGNIREACAYNERAGRIRPKGEAYLANRVYFLNQRDF